MPFVNRPMSQSRLLLCALEPPSLNLLKSYLEGQGGLVSRAITPR